VKAITRRKFVQLAGAAGAVSMLPMIGCATPAARASAPRVVVVGGGFAGATCAKYVRRYDAGIEVILVEPNKQFVTCPGSNWVLAGLRGIDTITHGYDGLRSKHGVKVVHDRVSGIDPARRVVQLAGGQTLAYDKLVVAPGIDLRWNAIDGYDEAASQIVPHAWKAGPQTMLLLDQLRAMPDGGTVIITAPGGAFRCPPGPPERASMIAHYLKTHKPRSKILLLDAKEDFTKQGLFMDGWQQFYPGMIEWVPASKGGALHRVDVANKAVYTENGFTRHKADVLNVIPPQTAGRVALDNGLANDTGWCPIDQATFESKLHADIHVIGDAAIAGAMPKSGHAANNHGKLAAVAVVSAIRGYEIPAPSTVNTCYSLITPNHGITVAAVYRLKDGVLAGVEGAGGLTPRNADAATFRREANYAAGWYTGITEDTFG
jgi:sulfide dehydrogenase [flavocytochrome c] flavoprotein subunit